MSTDSAAILDLAAGDRAYRDDLTGLFNYRLLAELLEQGWDSLAQDGALSLVILDLDLFKDVNDTYGHLTGNRVLQDVAELLTENFRQDDVVIRYGGDEFVIICPGAVHEVAKNLALRAREAVDEHNFSDRDTKESLGIEVSFSVGLASFPDDGQKGEGVLEAADRRLFEDKMARRRARRSGRSPGSRLALLALAILVMGLLIVIYAMAERWSSEPVDVARPLPNVPHLQEPVPMESRELELQLELERLREQVDSLLTAQPESELDNSQAAADYEEMLSTMRRKVEDLERELADSTTQEPIDDERAGSNLSEVSSAERERPPNDRAESPAEAEELRGSEPVHSEDSRVVVALPPKLLHIARPIYPVVARRMRKEATIELRLVVDAEGRVLEATPTGPTIGMGLEEAARRAALKAEYVPGYRDGVAVTCETTLAVEFRLSSN